MDEPKVAIYDVVVNNKQEKAINAVHLKRWLEEFKYSKSIVNIDVTKIDPEEPIMPYIAKACMDALIELEMTVDKALGLYEEPEPESEPEPEPEEKPEEEDNSEEVEEPEVLKDEPKDQPEEKSQEQPIPEEPGKKGKDNEITI